MVKNLQNWNRQMLGKVTEIAVLDKLTEHINLNSLRRFKPDASQALSAYVWTIAVNIDKKNHFKP